MNFYSVSSILKRQLSNKLPSKIMTSKTLPTPPASNLQVREYTTAVAKGYNSVFVTATTTGWRVLLPNTKTLVGTYPDMTTALGEAKKQAANRKSSYFVFDKAGELINTN